MTDDGHGGDTPADDVPAESRAAGGTPPVLQPIPAPSPHGLGRFPIRRWFALITAILIAMLAAAMLVTAIGVYHNAGARTLLVRVVDPANAASLRLRSVVNEQEAAVRGYALTGSNTFLDDYQDAYRNERVQERRLQRLLDRHDADAARHDLRRLNAALYHWRVGYARPTIAFVSAHGPRAYQDARRVRSGERPYVTVQNRVTTLQRGLDRIHDHAVRDLRTQVTRLYVTLVVAGGIEIAALVYLILMVRRVVLRPVTQLASQSSRVAGGDFAHPLTVDGPRELIELAGNVDSMRHRIVAEWTVADRRRGMLDRQTSELRRSNAELEQFAYVASHDLQEPLRKVSGFCELLESRYADRLDERGRSYVAYAADGARRMQTLISDLLSFSRVGRMNRKDVDVDLDACLSAALLNLAARIEETGAEVTADPLPHVSGEPTLLTQLLQNLIGNAVKFRGDEPPRVHIGVRPGGRDYEFSCRDNGIGIAPRHAERIFRIFQRLHGRDDYPGTGIGLAMCKKIVEYHGGTIWLADGEGPGATFRWTLPVPGEPRRDSARAGAGNAADAADGAGDAGVADRTRDAPAG